MRAFVTNREALYALWNAGETASKAHEIQRDTGRLVSSVPTDPVDQLREAHSADYAKAAIEAQTASLVAMHAALSAHHLVGAYELAGWLQQYNRAQEGK